MERAAIALMLFSLGCSEKGTEPEREGSHEQTEEPVSQELNVKPRERNDLSWEPDAPFTMDIRWRFQSGKETNHGYEVKGAWEISLRNTSGNRWRAQVWRLSFEDMQGFQVEEFSLIGPLIDILFEENESRLQNGNFYLTLSSIEAANEITKMTVWATFEKL